MGECLGLTWAAVDLEAGTFGEIVIEWQLQPLPYKVKRDRSSGFRVPDGYEARHLIDSYHLVRPKSRSGYRVAPLLLPVREALLAWREVAPANPYGLVWPEPNGRPRNDKHDRAAWSDLQAAAAVAHPSGRPYHVHECRNFAATMLLEAGVDEHVITTLLGHSSIVMSRKYMTVRREPLLDALTKVGARLQLG
jgi:integrase